MISRDILEEKIRQLELLAIEIETKGVKLFQDSPINLMLTAPYSGRYHQHWKTLPDDLRPHQRDVVRGYQNWYSSAYQLVKNYLPEKELEFKKYYANERKYQDGIIQRLQLRWGPIDKGRFIEDFINNFEIQRSIILSLPSVAEFREYDLRKIISVDFINTELDKADYLFRNKFERCAGVLAGVALEKHLRALCDIKNVEYKHDDTIEPLTQALYAAGKIDLTEQKNFLHLGGIRNDCAHPKEIPEEVLKARAKELIEKVRKMRL